MKKIISIFMAIIMIIGIFTTVRATTSSNLADEIYSIAKDYGMTEANRLRIERYLSDNPVTDEEADKVIEKIKEARAVFDRTGAKKYSELSDSQKDEIKSIAHETATIIGLTLKFKTRAVEMYKNGKLIEVARYDGDKLIYTGNNVNTVLVVSSIAAIALIVGLAARRKFANA